VRGFVERCTAPADGIGPSLFERFPVLRAIVIEAPSVGWRTDARPVWEGVAEKLAIGFARLPPDRIRRIEANADITVADAEGTLYEAFGDELVALVAAAPALAQVRELRLIGGSITRAAIPHLARLEITSLEGGTNLPVPQHAPPPRRGARVAARLVRRPAPHRHRPVVERPRRRRSAGARRDAVRGARGARRRELAGLDAARPRRARCLATPARPRRDEPLLD
jgi:hypothetical protein